MTDTRHDADTLARFLDGDGSLNGRVTEETRALAGLAHRLQRAAARPEPGRRQELRDELLAAARQRQADPPLRARARGWLPGAQRRRAPVPAVGRLAAVRSAAVPRVAALVGAAIIAVSGSGIAYGVEASLPGDVLYPVQLTAEEARLAFVGDRSARGSLHLERAAERIGEAEASAASGDDAGAAVALRHANSSARTGAGAILFSYEHEQEKNPESIDKLASFATTQTGRVTTLARQLRGEAADAAASTLVAFEQIEARATALDDRCPECGDTERASPAPRAPQGDTTPRRAEPVEPREPADADAAAPPAQPDPTRPASPPQELDPTQPRGSTPDNPGASAPANAPSTPQTPDAEDAVDPDEADPDDLLPRAKTPDLPF